MGISGLLIHVKVSVLVDHPRVSRLGHVQISGLGSHIEISGLASHVQVSGLVDYPRVSRLDHVQISG